MSDYNSSLPVRTENAGDVIIKVADATITSQQLAIDSSGRVTIKATDGAGNSLASSTTTPAGSEQALIVRNIPSGTQAVSGTVAATQSGTWDINNISGTISLPTGASTAALQTSGNASLTSIDGKTPALGQALAAASVPVVLTAAQLSTLTPLSTVAVTQSTSPWVISAASLPLPTGAATETTLASINTKIVQDFGVSTTAIRVAALLGNAAGVAAFAAGVTNAQTLRVVLPTDQSAIPASQSGVWSTRIQDGAGNALTSSAAGATRPLDVSLRDAAGALLGSSANPIAVAFAADLPGAEIINYFTSVNTAGGGSSNHDYTVTAAKTLYLKQIEATASGKSKIEVQVETGVASGTFNTRFVQFNSTATPNMSIVLESPIAVAAGVRVRVIRSNRDNQAQDLFSTILGQEI